MRNTLTCLSCSSKDCEKTEEGTFDICQYGISFIHRNGEVETKEPKVPLSTIAKNLRHEINPILQTIIEQASILDPSLSTRIIYGDKPLSLIVGSAVVLDNFIQMITGVHEFHSTPHSLNSKRIKLRTMVDTNYVMYGIVKENGRTKNLTMNNLIPENFYVSECSDLVKYTLAVLIDNAWKYSSDNSKLTVNINKLKDNYYRLKLTNRSKPIPEGSNIFEMGSKVNPQTKGFGYGLSWLRTLEDHYNNLLSNEVDDEFKVTHNQIHSSSGEAFQEFTIDNIKIEKE